MVVPHTPPSPPTPPPWQADGPLAIGQTIGGNYRVTHRIGGGAMGVVYEAVDELLPRHVAIKAPRFAVHAQALRREAEALALIRHHGFVTLHHVVRADGMDLLVMERLVGESLSRHLEDLAERGDRMEVLEVLKLLGVLAEALAAAHDAGFAHRDLKPGNVLLAGTRVVVLDLGLFIPEVLVGPDNVPAGSADYIAPEVLFGEVTRGEGELVDLYALGAIAHELLTGVAPYASESVAATLARHVSADVPDPRDLRADVPEDLAALVRELLAKSPRDRPRGAEEVAWRLAAIAERLVPHRHRTSMPPP